MATGSVSLDALWLHKAEDLETYITLGYRNFQETRDLEGSTAVFANGRLRALTGAGDWRTYSIDLKLTPRATLTALEDYLNVPVMLRDQRGRRMYGQIFGLSIGEDLLPGDQETALVGKVSFSFDELTLDDEV